MWFGSLKITSYAGLGCPKRSFEGEVRMILELYNIEHHKSSPYQPQANKAVEAANKNVKNILAKTVVTYKDQAENLPFVL
mgnify:CR=1 FL=1